MTAALAANIALLAQERHRDNKHERVGQNAMNTLRTYAPDAYDEVTATEADPFYNDSRIPAFYEWLTKREGSE